MNLILKILAEPAILIITFVFITFLCIVYFNYSVIQKNLKAVLFKLREYSANDLSYRFGTLDEFMKENKLTKSIWEDFKKALIFSGNLYAPGQSSSGADGIKSDILLTLDASYFFNEETLISSNLNVKFIQIMPTILTGMGPFFTFLKMAVAFASIDFTNTDVIADSLNTLLFNIQLAALCSVFAVGFSLLFMFLEKIIYNRMCRKYNIEIQKEFIRLFDIVTGEKFLVDLLKESRIQNVANEKLLKVLPEEIGNNINKAIIDTIMPYLENMLYGINNINTSINKNNGGNSDIIDKLF